MLLTSGTELWEFVRALLLLVVANGAPILGKRLLGTRFAWPLDGGACFLDRRPLFGPAKTVRGVLLSIAATALAAVVLGLPWQTGALFGAWAMAGDLASSFLKRRLGMPPSSTAVGLDQIPESLLPLLALRRELGLGGWEVAALTAAFFALGFAAPRLLYRLRPRARTE
jgi:CDP-2,3-bis-(O-geranylgeranyl)-sn-glycerol synthase